MCGFSNMACRVLDAYGALLLPSGRVWRGAAPRCACCRTRAPALTPLPTKTRNHKPTGLKYGSANVLADEGVREGVKAFTGWPTIPQVFVKGEFVGGSDILMEMHKSGELEKLVDSLGGGAKPAEAGGK